MSKHTEGPWSTGGYITMANGDVRQNVWGPIPAGMQSGEMISQLSTIANAKLIAAAPELLEALKALMESRRRDQFSGWEEGCPDFHKSEALAHAAIAKATE